jgi:hypothetical protein
VTALALSEAQPLQRFAQPLDRSLRAIDDCFVVHELVVRGLAMRGMDRQAVDALEQSAAGSVAVHRGSSIVGGDSRSTLRAASDAGK